VKRKENVELGPLIAPKSREREKDTSDGTNEKKTPRSLSFGKLALPFGKLEPAVPEPSFSSGHPSFNPNKILWYCRSVVSSSVEVRESKS
jgi:hypothetical protein